MAKLENIQKQPNVFTRKDCLIEDYRQGSFNEIAVEIEEEILDMVAIDSWRNFH